MIYLGLDNIEKKKAVQDYCTQNEIKKIIILSRKGFDFEIDNVEYVYWDDIIMYVTFYRLLQEIDQFTLVITNELLCVKNRHDLTYNCVRHFLNQTNHQLVFQYLPIIDNCNDFMTLFDFDTHSKWKNKSFDKTLIKESIIHKKIIDVTFNEKRTNSTQKTNSKYQKQKEKLFKNIGLKDPHTLPRNLYLISGDDKVRSIERNRIYVCRNKRYKTPNIITYKDEQISKNNVIFEFCHNHIDFVNFLFQTKQTTFDVLTTDLKADKWYFERYNNWNKELKDVYSKI